MTRVPVKHRPGQCQKRPLALLEPPSQLPQIGKPQRAASIRRRQRRRAQRLERRLGRRQIDREMRSLLDHAEKHELPRAEPVLAAQRRR